jgi:hypothetical protein
MGGELFGKGQVVKSLNPSTYWSLRCSCWLSRIVGVVKSLEWRCVVGSNYFQSEIIILEEVLVPWKAR